MTGPRAGCWVSWVSGGRAPRWQRGPTAEERASTAFAWKRLCSQECGQPGRGSRGRSATVEQRRGGRGPSEGAPKAASGGALGSTPSAGAPETGGRQSTDAPRRLRH